VHVPRQTWASLVAAPGSRLTAKISIADTRWLGYPRLRRMAAGHSASSGV